MWKEQRYVDLWSLVHFIFGALFVFLANFFEVTFLPALIALTVFATIWEVIEFASGKTVEFFSNRVTDVIFADIGFLFMYFLLSINNIEKEVYTIIFSLVVLIFIVLNISGWSNYIKRKKGI